MEILRAIILEARAEVPGLMTAEEMAVDATRCGRHLWCAPHPATGAPLSITVLDL
ncbi:hypothetical protein [Geodermatophilus sp. SYSU D01176]